MRPIIDWVDDEKYDVLKSFFDNEWQNLSEAEKRNYREKKSWWNELPATYYAVYRRNYKILALLLRHQFSCDYVYGYSTPLDNAIKDGAWELVELMAKYDYKSNARQFLKGIGDVIKARKYHIAYTMLTHCKSLPDYYYVPCKVERIVLSNDKKLLDALFIEETVNIPVSGFSSRPGTPGEELHDRSSCAMAEHLRSHNYKEYMISFLKKRGKVPSYLIIGDARSGDWDWVKIYLDNLILEYQGFTSWTEYYKLPFSKLLAIAVEQTNIDMIEYLLEKQVGQMEKCKGCAPVYHAAKNQHWGIVDVFTRYPTARYQIDYSHAAIEAAVHGQFVLAKGLITANAEISATLGAKQLTLLHPAVSRWHQDKSLLQMLIDIGADLNQPCAENLLPLQLAFKSPDRKVIPVLLKANAQLFPHCNQLILDDAGHGQWEAVKNCLDWAAEYGQEHPEHVLGELLHVAISQNRPDEIRYLLERGASPSFAGKDGKKPWIRAMELGHFSLIDVFLEFEFNPEEVEAGEVLLRACRIGLFALACQLVMRGAEVHKQMIESYCEPIVDAKGENSVQPVPKELVGFTPVHFAIISDELEITKLLLERSDGSVYRTAAGDTPFQLALKQLNPEMLELILSLSEKINLGPRSFKLLCDVAKSNTKKGWECIYVILNFEKMEIFKNKIRYKFYADMLWTAVAQDNREAILKLVPICLNQNSDREDNLSIVSAAKNRNWLALKELMKFADSHQQKRDFLLALFHSIQKPSQNNLSHALFSVINSNDIGELELKESELELAGLPPAYLGYSLLDFAVHFKNHELMERCFSLYHQDYVRASNIAFKKDNLPAVMALSQRGVQLEEETLLTACMDEKGWKLVVAFLENSCLNEEILLGYINLLRQHVKRYNAIDIKFLELFSFRRILAEVKNNFEISLRDQEKANDEAINDKQQEYTSNISRMNKEIADLNEQMTMLHSEHQVEIDRIKQAHVSDISQQTRGLKELEGSCKILFKLAIFSLILNPGFEMVILIAFLARMLYPENPVIRTVNSYYQPAKDKSISFCNQLVSFFNNPVNIDVDEAFKSEDVIEPSDGSLQPACSSR